MINLSGIVERLQDRRLDKIHEATGISKATIINVRDGKSQNPDYSTMIALSDYFEAQEQPRGADNNDAP